MSVVFRQRQVLGPNDLRIEFYLSDGSPFDPYSITYAFYGDDPLMGKWRVGGAGRIPFQEAEGKYFVAETLTTAFKPGAYYIEWTMQRTSTSPLEIAKKQEFAFVAG
jgi:hypothetical protein